MKAGSGGPDATVNRRTQRERIPDESLIPGCFGFVRTRSSGCPCVAAIAGSRTGPRLAAIGLRPAGELFQNEPADHENGFSGGAAAARRAENVAAQIYLEPTPALAFNQFSVRFPTVISAGAKIFSKLKKGHPFCPFSSAFVQSRNLAETGKTVCRKLGGMGVWR